MMTLVTFAKRLGGMVDAHLRAREKQKGTVSLLATGAAFESWLSFEARLLLERERTRLGLTSDHCWIGNEYKKVDLGIIQYDDTRTWAHERWFAAIEFKMVYNNKNWKSQCDAAWNDLFPPARTAKQGLKFAPDGGRIAFIVIVRREYADGDPYQRKNDRRPAWHAEVKKYMLRPGGPYKRDAARLQEWEGRRIRLKSNMLSKDGPGRPKNYLQLWTIVSPRSSDVTTP
jgi:hypothetical protein